MAQPYVMGTQADLSHLLCASAATALQTDPPIRNACHYRSQDLRHPEMIVVEKSDERLPGLHSPWAFQVSRCYWNLQPHPSWSTPCNLCSTALCATQTGTLQHTTSCASHNTWFHCMYSAHPPCTVSHLLVRHHLPT